MGENENMYKRIFIMIIVLQALFIGVCSANSGRLADIGAEVFKERIAAVSSCRVTEFVISTPTGVIANSHPETTEYEFRIFNTSDNMVLFDVYVNQEGDIDSIVISGPFANQTNRKFLSDLVVKSMLVIGLSYDEMRWLVNNGSNQSRLYEGRVYSEKLLRDVYYSLCIEPNGFCINTIDKVSFKDRL